MNPNYPHNWNEQRVRDVLNHYEEQTDDEAVAEDENAYEQQTRCLMDIPVELVPTVRELIAKHAK